MDGYWETALYYTMALSFALVFAYLSDLSKNANQKWFFIFLSFLTILFFCGFRFFVGNDYAGYFHGFQRLHSFNLDFFEQRWEPGIYFIAFLFMKSPVGYIPFLFICSLITFYFIFKVLIREHVLYWGIFFTFTLGLLFMVNDQVRQGVALSIFLYSVQYIEQRNFKKYLLWIIIASLFHYSALVLIPLYYIYLVRIKPTVWITLIIVSYIIYQIDIFYNLLFYLVLKIPFYGELYLTRIRFFEIPTSNTGLGIIFRSLLALCIAIYYNKLGKSTYATIYLAGAVLVNVSTGFMPAERFTYYLVYTNIIVFPLLFKLPKLKNFSYTIVLVAFLFFELQTYFALEKHGAVPYRTVLFENLRYPPIEYQVR